MTDRTPPEGFTPFVVQTGFIGINGPLYGKHGDGTYSLGFWVGEKHCNPAGHCHGGWLASFADIQLAAVSYAAAKKDDPFFATMTLTTDYLAKAPLGTWVEGKAEVLRITRKSAFAQMTATADGVLCLRASGVFRV
jgi:uncharacterized protein (TIGR00369 family)